MQFGEKTTAAAVALRLKLRKKTTAATGLCFYCKSETYDYQCAGKRLQHTTIHYDTPSG
jgi:hypothetical protein